ncbi:NUDIX domain-containing protein [Rhizomonospora bruguierae]|uniref:NUDIX domain-containing protein n=1 Tax=Rhizomonospora bruguierae TaxID=1581705 RepID=UPI0020C0AE32|nr:NUDIX domain-containing protein [Micromonospora sp. NBRC 107566]
MWRHRFITDTWSWEIPIGEIRVDETAAEAAARETEEETGWRPRAPLRPLVYAQPSPGLMTSEHHIFQADSADHIGPPQDAFESDRIDWIPLTDVRSLIDKHDIVSGTTVAALLYLLASRNG